MAITNFSLLTSNQLTVWSRDFWKEARNQSFIMSFVGNNRNAMIRRVRELKEGHNGARAVLTLLNNADGDGVVGDNQLEGNEAELKSSECVINVDQWRYAHRLEGRMADQKAVVDFRADARDQAAYKAADIVDQLAFLTASGVPYTKSNTGVTRVGSQLPALSFAEDVTPPSPHRYVTWQASSASLLPNQGNGGIVAADTPSWKMLVKLKAFAVNNYVPQLRSKNGVLFYNVFLNPSGIAALKQDPDFMLNWRHADTRGSSNPLFEGTAHGGTAGIYVDGLNILEYRHVYNTQGALAGSKWGAGGAVDGQAVLLMGASALGFADLDRQAPIWEEKRFDYENSPGIAIGRFYGFKKPTFQSTYTNTVEDYAIVRCDTAI